jgi:hypothetical protein
MPVSQVEDGFEVEPNRVTGPPDFGELVLVIFEETQPDPQQAAPGTGEL